MRYGLDDDTIAAIQGVLAQHESIEKAILYGSRAKGNYRRGSDIDLTLVGEAVTLQTLYRVMDGIDDLFLPYMFDLSIFSHIDDPAVVAHIERVGKTFYVREESSGKIDQIHTQEIADEI